jgi:hypothetical protein
VNDDWRDLLAALEAAGARYLIVGAHALALHGVPRGTQDLDIWLDSAAANAACAWRALATFGAPLESLGVSVEDLQRAGMVIQLGLPPNRIDLLTSITGVASFDDAWPDRIEHELDGVPAQFISRRVLIANKRATGRRRDLSDLEALGELPPSP